MKLKVKHNGTDYSLKMGDFNSAVTDFDLSTQPLHVGFHKPLKNFYIEMTERVATDTLILSYWNGSAWTSVSGLEDETLGLTQSGFVRFTEDVDFEQEKTTVSGDELYWLRLTTSDTPASVSIHGINLVLSSDSDFGSVPAITDYLPDGKTSFIAFHQEARDLIVQGIRNSGKQILRRDEVNGEERLNARQVDVFDLLDIEEFRNASKYCALNLVFENLSKSRDDHFAMKAEKAHQRYIECLNSRLASIDEDDDGVADSDEAAAIQFIRIRRE